MMSKRQRKVVLRNLEILFLEVRGKLLIAPELNTHMKLSHTVGLASPQ